VVKGPWAAGKSYTLATVLKAFPESAYLDFTAMSEHAMIYDLCPIAHRFAVLYEAARLGNDRPDEPGILANVVRSLLSERCIRYMSVQNGPDGMRPRHIRRAGPTGLITTTTWAGLHAEKETRVLTPTIRDDPAQAAAVFLAPARRYGEPERAEPDLAWWHALQR